MSLSYRSLNPAMVYRVLGRIEGQIAAEDWELAEGGTRDLKDEARYQKSVGAAHLWDEFTGHVENLEIALRAHDSGGCIEELALLHRALEAIAGPEVRIVTKEE